MERGTNQARKRRPAPLGTVPRHKLEPLDSFPTFDASPLNDQGSQTEPAERPLPYGASLQKRAARKPYAVESAPDRRGRPKRRWPFILAGVFAVLVVAVGVCGFSLLKDAKSLKSEVSEYTSGISTLKDALFAGDSEQGAGSASKLVSTARQ